MSKRAEFKQKLKGVLCADVEIVDNLILKGRKSAEVNQQQTNSVFSDKWEQYSQSRNKEKGFKFQREWYLRLYGFDCEGSLAAFLRTKKVIFDAGCGLGYKAAWFATLAPESLVIGMDSSESALKAAANYGQFSNLFFIMGDIAETDFYEDSVDFVNCDQVIMHTEDPRATFTELARITGPEGELSCYFYARKALPRELLDNHFRSVCKEMNRQELWEMSEQLTELGRRLSELSVEIDCPDIPALKIKGGRYDIQRFIYWNFLKCFWNSDLGYETSLVTNFDWYSPSNAARFSEDEVRAIILDNKMCEVFFHSEEACFSGRFKHQKDYKP